MINQLTAITAGLGILGCIGWFLRSVKRTDAQIRQERQARGKTDLGI